MSNDGWGEEKPDHPSPDFTNAGIPSYQPPSPNTPLGAGNQQGQGEQTPPQRPVNPPSQPINPPYGPQQPNGPPTGTGFPQFPPGSGQYPPIFPPTGPQYNTQVPQQGGRFDTGAPQSQPMDPAAFQPFFPASSPYSMPDYPNSGHLQSPPPPSGPLGVSRRVLYAGIGALCIIVIAISALALVLSSPKKDPVLASEVTPTPIILIVTATPNPNATQMPIGQATATPILVSITATPAPTYRPTSTYPATSTTVPGKPSATPWPTYTPYPTYTPSPTYTPIIVTATFTSTPLPTATPAAPTEVNDDDPRFVYISGVAPSAWVYANARPYGEYQNDVHYTTNVGDSFTFTFSGTGIDWISETGPNEGNADITIDGNTAKTTRANLTSSGDVFQYTAFSVKHLALGTHTLHVVMVDGGYLVNDAVNVYP